MGNSMEQASLSQAVIVCEHIALDGSPILLAIRDAPTEAVDSGWQLLCNSGKNENIDRAQVWSIGTALEREGSLKGLLLLPVGARLVRHSASSEWRRVS